MSTDELKEFYEQDIVYRFDKQKIIFGSVIDTYDNLESDDPELQEGQIRISWLNNIDYTEVWNQDRVTLMSRNIRPGVIVRRLGKNTQRGYCRVSMQHAAVKIVGTDIVIENVFCDRLAKSSNIDYDTPVYLDNKFGRILHFGKIITLQSKCGSIVEILTILENEIEEDTHESRYIVDYNVGQRVKAVPSSFTGAKWKKKSQWMKRKFNTYHSFTVQKVDFTNIQVSWLEYDKDGPNYIIDYMKDEDIPRLILLGTIGDRILEQSTQRLLKIHTSDIQISKRDWIIKQSAMLRPMESNDRVVHHSVKTNTKSSKKIKMSSNGKGMGKAEDDEWSTDDTEYNSDNSSLRRKYYPRRTKQLLPVPEQTVLVEVLCTDSKATIVWQDGTVENDIPTTELYYFTLFDDVDFFPGECVVFDDKLESGKYGIVQKVDHLERTAFIKWFTYLEGDKEPVFDCMNEMSIYDIMKHPKFTFHPGNEVYSKSMQEKGFGTVIDSRTNGCISVKWLSGLENECWPQDIEVLPFNDAYDSTDHTFIQMPWEIEGADFIAPTTYEPILRDMATKCNLLKERVVSLKLCFREQADNENLVILQDILNDTLFNRIKNQKLLAVFNELREGIDIQIERLSSKDYQTNEVTSSKLENMQIENVKEKEEKTPKIQFAKILQEDIFPIILRGLEMSLNQAHSAILDHIESSVITEASAEVTMPTSNMPVPSSPMTAEDSLTSLTSTSPKPTFFTATACETYSTLDEAPMYHQFYNSKIEPTDKQKFFKRIEKEYKVLRESLPPGIWVCTYSDRLDLMSIMIAGPNGTPYEDGLFLFDIQLSANYPNSPPLVSYLSYSMERLNPNLYVKGTVCLSLLGTWSGDSTEVWGPNSTLLQLMISIQGLILVAEPYYNEPGLEKERTSEEGYKYSRTYNELVVLELVKSLSEMLMKAPDVFKQEILKHLMENGEKMYTRLKTLINDDEPPMPDFPLLPVSKGLKFSLNKALDFFMATLTQVLTNNK